MKSVLPYRFYRSPLDDPKVIEKIQHHAIRLDLTAWAYREVAPRRWELIAQKDFVDTEELQQRRVDAFVKAAKAMGYSPYLERFLTEAGIIAPKPVPARVVPQVNWSPPPERPVMGRVAYLAMQRHQIFAPGPPVRNVARRINVVWSPSEVEHRPDKADYLAMRGQQHSWPVAPRGQRLTTHVSQKPQPVWSPPPVKHDSRLQGREHYLMMAR